MAQLFALPRTLLSLNVPFTRSTLTFIARHAPNPLALEDLAVAIDADPVLLQRVSDGRQALPARFVVPIAVKLGLASGTVRSAAESVLELGFEDRTGERPYPPDRLLGEPFVPVVLAATQPVIFPGA